MEDPPPPTLILLPGGLCVSGVALWASRLASALARAGSPVSLALFAHPDRSAGLALPLDPRVRRVDLSHLPPVERSGGDFAPYLPQLLDETYRLSQFGTATLLPNQHGDCFGLVAALAMTMGNRVRVVGTAHSDNAYDLALLTHYEPMLARVVAVSEALEAKILRAVPARHDAVRRIPYGVPIPAELRPRSSTDHAPLRLLYAGRYEHRQKRTMALPMLADLMTESGIPFELTLAGEGPARAELERACAGMTSVRVLGALTPDQLAEQMDAHDALVLSSRYEGLAVSMLESMARGCVPIVARCDSGSAEAIEDGVTGLLAEVSPDADERETARAMLEAVRRFRNHDRAALAENAIARAKARYSLGAHAFAWQELLRETVRSPERWWPATRPAAFTASPGALSGSVPESSAIALRTLLRLLAGRAILIHGAGRHTIDLAPLLAGADVRALADDDPARHGERLLGWKVISPHDAALTGATDVVISSAMHEEAIWNRREIYEEQGLRVHRLSQAAQVEPKPGALAAASTSP